jgi:isopentenyl-diphosphate delta-isomerase
MKEEHIESRKDDHIRINLEKNVQSKIETGLNDYQFIHNALPEINLDSVNTEQFLFGKSVKLPILISSMTGGTEQAQTINHILSEAAEKFGLAMGVGSQRAAISNPDLSDSFRVRQIAPNILLFANLGAIQLNYGFGVEECIKAVEMIGADALILHLNALQEAIQPEGDTKFSGLLGKIGSICNLRRFPVIVKEVGWGIGSDLAKKLIDVGVAAIDVSGAGGTSWSQVERFRLTNAQEIEVAESFIDWGIPTASALVSVKKALPNAILFASGGLKNGKDLSKCIALGANLAGLAGHFLKTAMVSSDELINSIAIMKRILRISMFATGSKNIEDFQKNKITLKANFNDF